MGLTNEGAHPRTGMRPAWCLLFLPNGLPDRGLGMLPPIGFFNKSAGYRAPGHLYFCGHGFLHGSGAPHLRAGAGVRVKS
jgi:hypothetical protein